MGDSRTPLKLRLVHHLKDDEYYDEQWSSTDVIYGSIPTQNVVATDEMNSVFLALMWSQFQVRVDHFAATKTAKTDLAILGVYRILFQVGWCICHFSGEGPIDLMTVKGCSISPTDRCCSRE
jgi:hypothetical protein